MKKAENKDIGRLIFELEPLIFKMETLSSLCLVITNAGERVNRWRSSIIRRSSS